MLQPAVKNRLNDLDLERVLTAGAIVVVGMPGVKGGDVGVVGELVMAEEDEADEEEYESRDDFLKIGARSTARVEDGGRGPDEGADGVIGESEIIGLAKVGRHGAIVMLRGASETFGLVVGSDDGDERDGDEDEAGHCDLCCSATRMVSSDPCLSSSGREEITSEGGENAGGEGSTTLRGGPQPTNESLGDVDGEAYELRLLLLRAARGIGLATRPTRTAITTASSSSSCSSSSPTDDSDDSDVVVEEMEDVGECPCSVATALGCVGVGFITTGDVVDVGRDTPSSTLALVLEADGLAGQVDDRGGAANDLRKAPERSVPG